MPLPSVGKNKGKMFKTLAVYAQEDMEYFEEFDKGITLLKKDRLISPINIHKVDPGVNMNEDLLHKINDADIFIFFVSPDLMAWTLYEFIIDEALKLRHEEHKLIIPILSRKCDKDERIYQFEALPHNDLYIKNHPDGVGDCINGIIIQKFRKLVEEMPPRPTVSRKELDLALKEFNYKDQKNAFRKQIQKQTTNIITSSGTQECGLNFMSKAMLYRQKLLPDWATVSTIDVRTERFSLSFLSSIKYIPQVNEKEYLREQLPYFWQLIRDQLFPNPIYQSPDQIAKAIFERMRFDNVIVCLDNHNTLLSPLISLFWSDFLEFYQKNSDNINTNKYFIFFIFHKSQNKNAILKLDFQGQVQQTYLELEPVTEMTRNDLEEWFSDHLPTGSKEELPLNQDKYSPIPLLEIICKHYGYSKFFNEHIRTSSY